MSAPIQLCCTAAQRCMLHTTPHACGRAHSRRTAPIFSTNPRGKPSAHRQEHDTHRALPCASARMFPGCTASPSFFNHLSCTAQGAAEDDGWYTAGCVPLCARVPPAAGFLLGCCEPAAAALPNRGCCNNVHHSRVTLHQCIACLHCRVHSCEHRMRHPSTRLQPTRGHRKAMQCQMRGQMPDINRA